MFPPMNNNSINLSAALASNVQITGLSANVNVAIGASTSWAFLRVDSGGNTIDTLATGLSVALNTKVRGAVPRLNLIGRESWRLRITAAGPAPTGGGIVRTVVYHVIEAPETLPNA